MVRIAVLTSGGGTNLEAILCAEEAGEIRSGRVELVIADREGCHSLKRAENHGRKAILLDRKKLGNIVFSDTDKMQILTDITWEYMEQELDKILLQKQPYFIFDWALLPKVKYWDMCDMKILVTSDDNIRKKRILERDHISEEYLEKRESATLDYSKFSFDFTFNNNYTKESMDVFIEVIYNKIMNENK